MLEGIYGNFATVALYLGLIDAAFALGIGAVATVALLFDIQLEKFWGRAVPAVLILIGSSIAAGIIMAVAKWASSLIA